MGGQRGLKMLKASHMSNSEPEKALQSDYAESSAKERKVIPKELVSKAKILFESGQMTVKDISEKIGIKYQTLYAIVKRNHWKVKEEGLTVRAAKSIETAIVQSVEDRIVSKVERYLEETFKVAKIIQEDALRIRESEVKDNRWNLDKLETMAKIQKHSHDLGKSALRIQDVAQTATNGGNTVNQSYVVNVLASVSAAITEGKIDPKTIDIEGLANTELEED